MNSKDIIEAFSYIAKEKNVEKTYLTSIIEEIFTSMILKKYGEEYEPNFSTIVNMERGEIEIFHEKKVVDSVKDDITEISIEKAIKIQFFNKKFALSSKKMVTIVAIFV